MSKMRKPKSLSEKIANVLAEENDREEIESLADENKQPTVVDFDEDEYQLSSNRNTEFRKRNVKLLSEQSARYRGVVTSRAELQLDQSDSDEKDSDLRNIIYSDDGSDDSADEEDDSDDDRDFNMEDSEMGSEEDEEEEDDATDTKSHSHWDAINDLPDITANDMEFVNTVDVNKEVQKGVSVKNQLYIWERLLELRINSQKLITGANQLPAPDVLKQLLLDTKYKDAAEDACKNLKKLLESLCSLKTLLIEQNSEMRSQVSNNQTQNQNCFEKSFDLANAETSLEQINKSLQNRWEEFHQYRNSVLLKWDDRTKVILNAKQTKSLNADYDILKKISNTLMQKHRLLQKSQMIKNDGNSMESAPSISTNAEDDSTADSALPLRHQLNPEIYNDDDFYHHQLRELIEYKSNTADNTSEMKKAYAELRHYRQQIKRKVDTRASKGRKLRYKVHNKLINFMAPVDNTTWNSETVSELSKSLFV